MKANCFPVLTDEVIDVLSEFYVTVRQEASQSYDGKPITARDLKPKYKCEGTELLTLEVELEAQTRSLPEDIPLNIVYEDDEDEYDIKPNRPYDKVVDKLKRKIETTTSAKNSKLYKEILNVLQSKQYLAQKRVVLNEELFEKCIDFWPEMFDGIECKIDNDGNGVPDEDEWFFQEAVEDSHSDNSYLHSLWRC